MARTLQQEYGLSAIAAWLRTTDGSPVFTVTGPAGTGKTSLLTDLLGTLPEPTVFAAYTGKAAAVMAAKGCTGATTLHRVLYHAIEDTDARGQRRLRFELNMRGLAAQAAVIVVDEASMIGPRLAQDLLSFKKKVLVLGDPEQLPPVDGDAALLRGWPGVQLTEVHRQAWDNPIIRLATAVRQGQCLRRGVYGDSVVVGPDGLEITRVLAANQVLVGTNAMRERLIRRLRQILGRPEGAPVVGDRLVCLRNNAKRGFYNGGTWIVTAVFTPDADGRLRLEVRPDADSGLRPDLTRRLAVRPEFFVGAQDRLSDFQRNRTDHFAFAQALSIHKAQGSQWSDVTLFDESEQFRGKERQLLYTGLTRAAHRLTVVSRRFWWSPSLSQP